MDMVVVTVLVLVRVAVPMRVAVCSRLRRVRARPERTSVRGGDPARLRTAPTVAACLRKSWNEEGEL